MVTHTNWAQDAAVVAKLEHRHARVPRRPCVGSSRAGRWPSHAGRGAVVNGIVRKRYCDPQRLNPGNANLPTGEFHDPIRENDASGRHLPKLARSFSEWAWVQRPPDYV